MRRACEWENGVKRQIKYPPVTPFTNNINRALATIVIRVRFVSPLALCKNDAIKQMGIILCCNVVHMPESVRFDAVNIFSIIQVLLVHLLFNVLLVARWRSHHKFRILASPLHYNIVYYDAAAKMQPNTKYTYFLVDFLPVPHTWPVSLRLSFAMMAQAPPWSRSMDLDHLPPHASGR